LIYSILQVTQKAKRKIFNTFSRPDIAIRIVAVLYLDKWYPAKETFIGSNTLLETTLDPLTAVSDDLSKQPPSHSR